MLSHYSIDAQTINYSVHANIIYHFTKYINWPADKKSGDFTIGVIGDISLTEELKETTLNKMVGTQRIVIKQLNVNQASYNCNILFISEEETKNIRKIIDKTQRSPILIITESVDVSSKNYCINMIIENEHLKLLFNKENIFNKNLQIASELLALGVIVD